MKKFDNYCSNLAVLVMADREMEKQLAEIPNI